MAEALQYWDLESYPDFKQHEQEKEIAMSRVLPPRCIRPVVTEYPTWRDHVLELLATSGHADKLAIVNDGEQYCDLAPHHLLAALSIPIVNGNFKQLVLSTPKPEAVRTAGRKTITIQRKDDLNDALKEEIKFYLAKFHALEDCLKITALYCRFYLSYSQYDLFAPKRMLFQLQLPDACRVVLIVSIQDLRVGSLEALRDEQGDWIVEFPDFCLPSGSLCYSSWGIELVVLQPEEGAELLPDDLQLLLQFDKYFLQAVWRYIFVQLSLPLEFNQQRSGMRALWGSIRDGCAWQEVSYRPPLFNKCVDMEAIPQFDFAGPQCFALSLPGRSMTERFLIEVSENTEQYSELEWAICTGDLETVERIIRQLENKHLLPS